MTRLFAILAVLTMLAAPAWAEGSAAPSGNDKAVVGEALDQPKMDDKAIMAYATEVVVKTMTFDNKNFQSRFLEASPQFTKSGWQSFSALLKNSGVFDKVVSKHYAMTAEAAEPASIRKQGAKDGVYNWEVDVPLTVHYVGTDDEHDDPLRVHVVIERVPAGDSTKGVLINEWMAQ